MTDAPQAEKTLAQVAYETFLFELAKAPHGAEEVEHAPAWENVPEHVREVIAAAVAAAIRAFAPALVPDASPEDQSFGQVGYQAYVASTGGLNYQGLPCPEWSKLTDAIRAAWAAAAVGIRSEHEHRFAGDYDLVASTDELAELIAGLDALQRADKHQAEVTFPLRSRLRGILFPPEPEPAQLPEADGEAPTLELSAANEDEKPEPSGEAPANTGASDAQPPGAASSDPAQDGEVIADNALDPPAGAPELTAPERTEPATTAESAPTASAPEGNVAASPAPELPSVSEAPPAPGLPGLEPVIPAAPPLPVEAGTDAAAPGAPGDASPTARADGAEATTETPADPK